VSLEYPPNIYGGVGIHVYNLVRHFHEMDVPVEVICPEGMTGLGQHIPQLPIVVHRISMRERMFPLNWLSFSEKVDQFLKEKEADYDLVHEHLGIVTRCSVPLVCTLHSLVKREIVEEGCKGMPLMKAVIELESHSIATSSGLIGVSQQVIDSAHQKYGYTGKTRRIFNGLDAHLFRRLSLARIFDVTFVGRFTKSKGIDHLLKALTELESWGMYLSVLFCGVEGGAGGGIQKWLRTTHHDVFFIVNKSHIDMPRIYNRSKILVATFNYDSFALVPLEALACETPVIISRAAGLVEALEDLKCGVLVIEPSDPVALAWAIRDLLQDEPRRNKMGKLGRKWVIRRFDWRQTAIQTLEFYREVLG